MAWYHRWNIFSHRFWLGLSIIDTSLDPEPQPIRQLQRGLLRMTIILMVAIGLPLNVVINVSLAHEVWVGHRYAEAVYYNHLLSMLVINGLAILLLQRRKYALALGSIIVICAFTIYVQVWLMANGALFVMMILPVGLPALVLSSRAMLSLLAILTCIMLALLHINPVLRDSDWVGAISIFWGIALSFLGAGIGLRRVLEEFAHAIEVRHREAIERTRAAVYTLRAEELAVAGERNRIAREIHDSVGHMLMSVNMQIQAAQARTPENMTELRGLLDTAQRHTKEAVREVRHSVTMLRNSTFDAQPIPDLVNKLLEDVRSAGIHADLTVKGLCRTLPPSIVLNLYRAIQESVTNILKHASATRVEVVIDYTSIDRICLTVRDNGRGADNLSGGYGIIGIRERTLALDGSVEITTQPCMGFTLHIEIPT